MIPMMQISDRQLISVIGQIYVLRQLGDVKLVSILSLSHLYDKISSVILVCFERASVSAY